MKNFKVLLVEILIQLTILASITRYKRDTYFEQNFYKSLKELESYNFINNHKDFQFDSSQFSICTPSSSATKSTPYFDFNLQDKQNYLNSIVDNRQNRRHYNIYFNQPYYLKVSDKFLEYPELQTKNSLLNIYNNENISPEVSIIKIYDKKRSVLWLNKWLFFKDMNEIRRILFEQDIDIGIDRGFYDPEYRVQQLFEKKQLSKEDNNFIDFSQEKVNCVTFWKMWFLFFN